MKKQIFSVLMSVAPLAGVLQAQSNVWPQNGADGISWRYDNSFVISWAPVKNAVAYEYVLTDNPLCYRGCSGDTRYAQVKDTFAISFEMQRNKWYYWVTRVITETDTSDWSEISAFFSKVPEGGQRLFQLYPNPVSTGEPWNLSIDWFGNNRARKIQITLYDLQGIVRFDKTYSKLSSAVRFENFTIDLANLTPGIYMSMCTVDDNPYISGNRTVEKVVILE